MSECTHERTQFPARPEPDAWYQCPDCGVHVGRRGGRIVTVTENNAAAARARARVDPARVREREAARIRRLYAQMERLRAELTAVETGTLPLLEDRGELVAAELAEAVGVSVQAANNRLVALVRAGLAERVRVNPVRGGKRFVYRAREADRVS